MATLFEELDAVFTNHTHYYTVGLPDMNEALEKCARLLHSNAQVINYGGQMILASHHSLGDGITWLTEIPRPVVEPVVEEVVVEESAPKKGK
jgi:hypothetical protein